MNHGKCYPLRNTLTVPPPSYLRRAAPPAQPAASKSDAVRARTRHSLVELDRGVVGIIVLVILHRERRRKWVHWRVDTHRQAPLAPPRALALLHPAVHPMRFLGCVYDMSSREIGSRSGGFRGSGGSGSQGVRGAEGRAGVALVSWTW